MVTLKNLTKWQNYAHYLILTAAVFGIHKLTEILGLEANVVAGEPFAWVWLFLFYAFGIFVADTIIHLLFAAAPEPIKWED